MKRLKILLCTAVVLLLAGLCAVGAAADTTVGVTGAGSFRVEQTYVNVPELDVYFYALDQDGNPYSAMKVQAAGPELTLGDRRLDTRSITQASDPICYIVAIDNSDKLAPADFYKTVGGVRKLVQSMGDTDQLMLYSTAGEPTCVLPATSEKELMYKALGSLKQAEGAMDTAKLAAAVYSDVMADYQALAPRKAAFICTDASQIMTNLTLLGSALTDAGDQLGMAFYTFLTTEKPEVMDSLVQAANGRLIACQVEDLGQELLARQTYMQNALEIRTEVPESMAGERLETLTLALPSLGSAIRSTQTVYMGHTLEKPQVTDVKVRNRTTLMITFNQPINENADKQQLYDLATQDLWGWHPIVKKVEINEDGRSAVLTTEPLYMGQYTIGLNRVSSRMSAANVSNKRQTASFRIAVWPRDRGFYLARFRLPILIAVLLLAALGGSWWWVRHKEHAAEQEAEAEHLLANAGEPDDLPKRWITLFWGGKGSIAESRWAGLVESSLIIGSDAAQCDLCLPDRTVRPQHCALLVQGDSVLVCPLGEKSRVCVNGERIDGEHRLQNSDTLRVGKVTVRLVL